MRLIPAYRDRASPLHAARAGATAALCGAFALVPGVTDNPYVLVATGVAILGAGIAAGVGRELRRSFWLSLPLALLITAINPLVYPSGNTLLVRGGDVLGRRIDITLEALAAGAIAGLRLTVFMLAFALFSACVDPDELLRAFRRVSYRSALTAALATRLVPVLARDALRMGDAARCRPEPPARLAVTRAALSGALDRAVDVAAALEVRGYSAPGRPARGPRRAWSRHDLRIVAAALVIAVTAIAGAVAGAAPVEIYPTVEIGFGAGGAAMGAAALLGAALPFAGRRARLGVARA
jgi:energy-coupling factor transport system permease protein